LDKLNCKDLHHVNAVYVKVEAAVKKLCGLAASPRALSGALGRMLTLLNMPKTLAVEDPAAVAAASLADRCTAANPRTPTQAELEEILRGLAR